MAMRTVQDTDRTVPLPSNGLTCETLGTPADSELTSLVSVDCTPSVVSDEGVITTV